MKRIFIFGLAVLIFNFLGCLMQNATAVAQTKTNEQIQSDKTTKTVSKIPILVELFTSEGCPTCPPADANLALLEREQPFAETEIVTLALHVDYWNSLKWKDEYSSPIFSRRQQLYSQALKTGVNYTPQMFVDGRTEFVGSNMAKAQKAILEAAKTPKAKIEIALMSADKLKVNILDVPVHQIATIFLAVTEDNLISNRKYGSPAERKAAHMSVVREIKSIGMMPTGQSNLELETVLQIQPEWRRENLKLVVFVQENASRKILGVNRKKLQ